MQLLSGSKVAEKRRLEIKISVRQFTFERGRAPGLAVVLVGEDPASQVYVKNKIKACHDTGIQSFHHQLSARTSEDELLKLISKLNSQAEVDGILVQLPLPKHINTDRVISAIWPKTLTD